MPIWKLSRLVQKTINFQSMDIKANVGERG